MLKVCYPNTDSEKENKITTIVTVVSIIFMGFSLYFSHTSMLSIIYQVAAVGFSVIFCSKNLLFFIPLLLLSTTRSYIEVSTNLIFSNYFTLNGTMVTLILLGVWFYMFWKQNMKTTIYVHALPIIFLGFHMLISQFWANSLLEYKGAFFFVCVAYIVLPNMVNSEEGVFNAKFAYVISGLFLGIGIVPYVLSFGSVFEFSLMADNNHFLVDRNYLSLFLLICMLQSIIFLGSYWRNINIVYKLVCFSQIIIDLFLILSFASRSAFIALVIALGIYVLINFTKGRNLLFFSVLAFIVFLVLIELGMLDFVWERFTLSNISSGNGRFDIWEMYITAFENGNIFQILFGRGLVGQVDIGLIAHNMFISILYCFGILGLCCVVIALCTCVSIFIRYDKKNELIVLIPILFMSLTIEPYYQVEFAIYLALTLGTALYYSRKYRKNRRNYCNEI